MSAPYVPFYTSDFLGGTSGMTAATKGVYITLLCLMYEEEGPLPQKWDTLARRCGCTLPAFTKAIQDLVDDGKVAVLGSGLWSDKCEKHIAHRSERRDSAKAAAEKRWEKVKQNQGMSDANAMRETCQPEPEPELKKEDTNVSLQVSPAGDVAEAVRVYNDAASQAGWPSVQKLTPARSRSLKARIADAGGMDGWRFAVERAAQSDFLCGRTSKPWTGFGFDWLTKAANFTKIMEGNYDNRTHHNARLPQGRQNRPDPALEQIARLAGIGQAPGNGGF